MNGDPNREERNKEETWMHLLPEIAPLPRPFVEHILQYTHRLRFEPGRSGNDAFQTQADPGQLWRLIQRARKRVFFYLNPHVSSTPKGLSSAWLRDHFQMFDNLSSNQSEKGGDGEKVPSRSTVTDWQMKHLLRNKQYGVLEENSVAALLMMRYLFQTRRDWLPASQEEEEPWFWVWGLAPGERFPQQYPYPLPTEIAANSLLWSSWPGAAWCPGWRRIEGWGAIAWAGTLSSPESGQWYWKLSEADLRAWDSPLTQASLEATNAVRKTLLPGYCLEHGISTPDDENSLLLHHLAEIVLNKYGTRILQRFVIHYYATAVPVPELLLLDDIL